MKSIFTQSSQIKHTPQKSDSWSEVTKQIRNKVQSKIQGFDNQTFIQKSDILYNFKNKEENNNNSQALSLRSSTSYLKNHMENKFPKQESPIKMGLYQAIYSPKKNDDFLQKNNSSSYFQPQKDTQLTKLTQQKKPLYQTSKSNSDVGEYFKKNKNVTERTTMAEIIRISNHLQDVQVAEASGLSSAYLSELMALQQNINKVLKNSNNAKLLK